MRVLIVDDEPLARERIADLLARVPDVSVTQCGNGEEAVALIPQLAPDLVFLDVQMPGLDGFGVLDRLRDEPLPLVVFVTAYDQYAVRAFDVHALDYLLKPFDAERFHATLARAREALATRTAGSSEDLRRAVAALVAEMRPSASPPAAPRVISVKDGQRIVPVRTDDIDWIEAEGNYVRLHVGKTSLLLRETIAALEASLDPGRFRRIHRSTIVNVERIRELQPWFRKDYRVLLRDGTQLTLSRSYTDRVRELLGRAD